MPNIVYIHIHPEYIIHINIFTTDVAALNTSSPLCESKVDGQRHRLHEKTHYPHAPGLPLRKPLMPASSHRPVVIGPKQRHVQLHDVEA